METVTKKVVADEASGGMWNYRNLRQVNMIGDNRSTPGNIRNAVRVVKPPPDSRLEYLPLPYPVASTLVSR